MTARSAPPTHTGSSLPCCWPVTCARAHTRTRLYTCITHIHKHTRTYPTLAPGLTFQKNPINSVEGENQMTLEIHPVFSVPRSSSALISPHRLSPLDLEPDRTASVSYPGGLGSASFVRPWVRRFNATDFPTPADCVCFGKRK